MFHSPNVLLLLFINYDNRTIYICECKNIRFKQDYKEYKKDYDKFKTKFEPQLERKINWANKNREIIQEHFKLRDNKIETIDILNLNKKTKTIHQNPQI